MSAEDLHILVPLEIKFLHLAPHSFYFPVRGQKLDVAFVQDGLLGEICYKVRQK